MELFKEGEDTYSDEDSPHFIFTNGRDVASRRRGKGKVVYKPDGDVHVCYGMGCKDLITDGDRQLVCPHSGVVVGNLPARDSDLGWSGRTTNSSNPDDFAGVPLGGWQKRRDMFSASVSAWQLGRIWEKEDGGVPVPSTSASQPEQKRAPVPKRGALCVDEIASSEEHARRCKVPKRDVWTSDAIRKLDSEALQVVDALLVVPLDTPSTNASVVTPERGASDDPRLQNVEFVRGVALRKAVRARIALSEDMDLDAIHNVCIQANEFVRNTRMTRNKQRHTAESFGSSHVKRATSGRDKQLLTSLITALWRAACSTPYMLTARKGNDSFRPFCAGALYTLKRGLYLTNGTCIIPELPSIAARLPGLRSQYATPTAKQLQSSSHKGICSLHRSITSIANANKEERERIMQKFGVAATRAAVLRQMIDHQG